VTAPTTHLPAPQSLHEVPGWFYRTDIILFDWFLHRQHGAGVRGDLLELGSYMGKSAVLMRAYLGEEETFTVCDLFGTDAPDTHNQRETNSSYDTLTRRSFEAHYLAFHDELPRILHAPTSVVPEDVASGSCRFVHVDASHLYEHVRSDIANARKVLAGNGLLVLDDYRSSHTPGVACAAWQAVLEDGLRPVCVSGNKLYGTWDDPAALQQELHDALAARGDCRLQWQHVAGQRLLLVGGKEAALPALPVSRHAEPPKSAEQVAREKAAEQAEKERKAAAQAAERERKAAEKAARERSAAAKRAEAERRARSPRARLVRVAKDVLPPVLTRAVVRARKRRRGGAARTG
jgi:hypothetical protein